MADELYSDILVEGNIATWEMRLEGEIQGTYAGMFKFRCFLTPTQQIAANREYRELLGNNPTLVPEHESSLAYSLTQLKYRIIQAPPFWSSSLQLSGFAGDIPDENVILKVLDKAINAELKYKELLKKKKSEAIDKSKKAAERMIKQQQEEVHEGENETSGD